MTSTSEAISKGSKPIGLTTEEAKEKLIKFGPNEFVTFKETDFVEIITSQFPLQLLILMGAAILLLLSNVTLAVSVFFFIFLMVVSETWRELAVRNAIKHVRTPYFGDTIIIRDGLSKRIRISEVVPGDIVVLKEGMLVPADGIILKAKNCTIDENIFGRGVVVKKSQKEVVKTFEKQEDQTEIFAGTFIVTGECLMRVS